MEQNNDKDTTLNLFDLEGISVRELFSTNIPLWEVLDQLESFLQAHELYEGCENVHVEGSVFLGKGSIVKPGAMLRGPIVIGENCVIGHGVEIVRSLVLDRAKIAHLNYVGDSIVGSGVNLGAGSVCANVRLDRGQISVGEKGARTNTGRTKLGALIGDGASIGCNAVLNPGSIVQPGALVFPCTNLGGVIK